MLFRSILPSFEIGGAEKVMVTLYNNVEKKNFETFFCVFQDGPLRKKINNHKNIFFLNKKKISYGFYDLLKVIYRVGPDIIFCTHSHLNALVCLAKKFKLFKAKVIIRESNFLSKQQSLSKSFYEKYIVTWFIKNTYSASNHIVCQTKEMMEDMNYFFHNENIKKTVIYNPLDFIPEYIVKKTKKTIISIGRLEQQKNQRVLIEAFDLICHKIPHNLCIIGRGTEFDNLEKLIRSKSLEDRVDLVGFVESPWDVYQNSSLFVLSSDFEGFPNVIIESMANSTPVKIGRASCRERV